MSAYLYGDSHPALSQFGSRMQPISPYGNVWFVDGNQGGTGYSGRNRKRGVKTLAAALADAASGDVLYVRGNITENIIAPAGLFNITIIGAGTRPRHADAHTGNAGYSAATWKAAVQSDPLLTVRQQGWSVQNMLLDAPTTDACIDLIRDAAAGDSERDSSHFSLVGCRLAGGQDGVRFTGTENVFNVLLLDNDFHDLTNAIISSGGYSNMPQIIGNRFTKNTNHIDVGCTNGVIVDNIFGKFTTKSIDLTGGSENMVSRNVLFGTYSNAGGYTAGTDDEWGGNYNSLAGGVTASDPA